MSTSEPLQNEFEPDGGTEREGFIQEYWSAVARRKYLILALLVLATAWASVRTYLTRDVFRADVQVLIDPGTPNILNFKDVDGLETAREEAFQNQLKLLTSRTLSRKAIEDMDILQEPEYGGPRDPKDVAAAKAARPGSPPSWRARSARCWEACVSMSSGPAASWS